MIFLESDAKQHPSTILLVDDDPISLTTISKILSEFGHQILVAKNGSKALQLVEDERPNLILLDIHMPGMNGIQVCKEIKSKKKNKRLPILFLTGSEDDAEAAFDAGGLDYILKPFRIKELIARVNTHLELAHLMASLENANMALETINDSLEEKVHDRTKELVTTNASLRKEINERRALQDRLDYISRYDFVTRMYNRNSMEEQLEQRLIEIHGVSTNHCYFLYIDLDQFRVINDTCGHLAGDELLRELSELLKGLVARDDIIARMGGDEFAIIFELHNTQLGIKKAQSFKRAIENFVFNWEGETFRIGASLGLIEIDDSFDNVNHLISIAERTCYESKVKGGGEISVYNMSKVHIDRSKRQMRWVPIIQSAVEHDDFYLTGQYINDIQDGTQNKMELLIRLETADQKTLPPGHFIPIAERYHLITSVDKWVLEKALMQKRTLGLEQQISINLSGESIKKESFLDYAEETITASGIKGEELCFEITETSAFTDIVATNAFIERFRKLGCQFSLDDFGTGTSSYGYLKELPIDYIKIDGIFIRDLEKEKVNRLMVDSITTISKEIGIKVIAECVETAEAFEVLKDIGVDYVQGFYLHKPTPLDQLSKQ